MCATVFMENSNSKKNVVYDAIKQAIITGDIEQGAILNEGELARQYGVSRTPAREALLMLSFEGLVNVLPRAGYMVTQITVRDVQEAFHLREILELETARLAACHITPAQLEILEARKMGVPPEINPIYNREFHLTIAEASGNSRLAKLITQLLDEMERILVYDPILSGPHDPEEHERIIQALRNKDQEAAMDAMRYHIRLVKSRVLERFS